MTKQNPERDFRIDHVVGRRSFLVAGAYAGVGLFLPVLGRAAETPGTLHKAIAKSQLVYISALKSDGGESRCHAEVWFAPDGKDLLVVTSPERWRAAAISKGLTSARLWVGEHGVWKESKHDFRAAPTCVAGAKFEKDPKIHVRGLSAFGKKYPDEWAKWGPRFEKGLASGERVMIRYTPDTK